MKKTYIQPEIWAEELKAESPLLVNSITNIIGKSDSETIIGYGGGGSGGARAGESALWDDDEENDSGWDHL